MAYTIPTVRTPHANVITLSYPNNVEILISYQTVVAACIPVEGVIAVEGTSVTTSRHINHWAGYKVRRLTYQDFWQALRHALDTEGETLK